MKKLLAFALLSVSAISASGATCAVLDYAEMKEMPIEELRLEYCKANEKLSENLSRAIANIGRGLPEARLQYETCRNQSDRMWRALLTKGADSSLRAENKYCNAR